MIPAAGEASVCVVAKPAEEDDSWSRLDAETRDRLNHQRANARARTQSRRYMAANGLRYMWVLTFSGAGLHGAVGRAEAMRQVGRFVRRLREHLGVDVPYWYSPELHPGASLADGSRGPSHGWHVNFFLGCTVDHEAVGKLWGHGHVWVSDFASTKRQHKGRVTPPYLERLRSGASYGVKYASKDWSQQMLADGAHRYEVAQSFQPVEIVVECGSVEEGIGLASDAMGSAPERTWSSSSADDWTGPPCVTLFWSATPPRGPGGGARSPGPP